MSKFASMADDLRKCMEAPLGALSALSPLEQLTACAEAHGALLDAMATVAAQRRAAVRHLRAEGWTLRAIGDLIGVSPSRVRQIELGLDRHTMGG